MNIFRSLITAASIALISTSTVYAKNPLPVSADKLVKYGDAGDWTVYENKTRGHCLIVSQDESGAVQMGVTSANDHIGYLGVFTKHDIGIRHDSKSKIFVSIDSNLYAGVATRVSEHLKGGLTGGYILTDNPRFIKDIAKKYEMVVFPKTAAAFVVDLAGTYKALEMARKCFRKA